MLFIRLPPPEFGLTYEVAIWSAKIDDISLQPPAYKEVNIHVIMIAQVSGRMI
jgi:hypothetical protein